ncbi:MAG: hypothetical protein QM756_25305 [Polyangiaceae bacterium]
MTISTQASPGVDGPALRRIRQYPDPSPLVQLGQAVVDSLLQREHAFVAEALLDDGLSERAVQTLRTKQSRIG